MDLLARATGISRWPGRPAEPAMLVHLPDGMKIARRGDERRWDEYQAAFGHESLPFWHWQEGTANILWELALRLPAWPPQSPSDVLNLSAEGIGWLGATGLAQLTDLPGLAADAFRPVGTRLRGLPERLRLFVDGQLLISAQAESREANALYGAAALDLPRRGVLHLEGGMGTIAQLLVQAVRQHGGRVFYRQEASRIRLERGRPVAVETRRGDTIDADLIVANLTPWNISGLLGKADLEPIRLQWHPRSAHPPGKWGAFVLYLGLDGSAVPPDFPLHHQVILRRPLGEGNTLFLSISPEWDESRAPAGKRALTVSTHTDLNPWWDLARRDHASFEARQDQYTTNLLAAAEQVLPGLRQAAELILPGTPLTFQRFTRREMGWVGGFQQTGLLEACGPHLAPNLWMVGDSIFPGQSVAAVALGGLRVAGSILREQKMPAAESNLRWNVAA